jgi:hypothetical protein
VLGAFFDDSGTHASAPVIVIGGLLGTEEQWDVFADAWNALLAHGLPGKPPLSRFHLSPCRAGADEFRDYSLAERDRITYLFRHVILDVGLVTIAVAVNKLAWNELVVDEIADQLGDPIGFCFVKCIDQVLTTIRFRKPGEKVFLFFDQAIKNKLEAWVQFYGMTKENHPEIEGMAFAPVPNVVALQGADMIATETYQYNLKWLNDRENAPTNANAHFRDYLKRELSVGIVFDRAQIAEMVQRVRAGFVAPVSVGR